MTPEGAPTVQQLLAFYLEAGVDCALTDEPVNRLSDPDVLVCLGDSSAQTLLGAKEGITRTRGRWFDYDTGTRRIRAVATFHPAYLLRTPLSKRLAWRDFLAIKKALAQSQ